MIAMFAALAVGAAASSGADDLTCRNGAFPKEQARYGRARVIGPGANRFLKDEEGCPDERATCRGTGYTVAGDVLLTGREHGAYACAFYPNKVGGSAGWVRRDRLSVLPVASAPPLANWAGRWHDGDDEIRLKVAGSVLVADGDAYWPSADPPLSVRPGGPNIGEMSGRAKPTGSRVVFSDGQADGCTVRASLVGPYLVVGDDNGCGGMNVSFTGVYRRR